MLLEGPRGARGCSRGGKDEKKMEKKDTKKIEKMKK